MYQRLLAAVIGLIVCGMSSAAEDPLPSWNAGSTKSAIMAFVSRVTTEGTPDFVPIPERIAVFDNDGTLWSEKPIYFQVYFIADRVKALAPKHPEWKSKAPFASILRGDVTSALTVGEKGLAELLAATNAEMTIVEFEKAVLDWTRTARHPEKHMLFTQMVYQPMLELLAYLRANGFKTFIVSGGGIDFMRPWTDRAYGIPPEQVVGSTGGLRFEMHDGVPELMKLPEIVHIDDGPGKPVGIQRNIGRRPIAAFGNSDGDLEMLQWTAGGKRPHFCLFVHHTDAKREWAYDRHSLVGRLDKGLDQAKIHGWTVVDMKNDWKVIYPPVEQE